MQKQKLDFSENIGIDHLRSASPSAYVSRKTLSSVSNVSEEDIARLGIKGFRWPSLSENNTTMVANTQYKFIKEDLERGENKHKWLEEYPIRTLPFLTESNSDRGKPDLAYALGIVTSKLLAEDEQKYRPAIEVLRRAVPLPITFNCGSGGIMFNTVLPSVAKGKSALFFAADTSIYHKVYSGKNTILTAGSGITAGVLSPESRVMAFDQKASASYFIDEAGFTKFFSHLPKTHGKLSQLMYDFVMIKAFEQLERGEKPGEGYDLSGISYMVGHAPFYEQPITYSTLPFVHETKHANPELMERLRAKIGKEELNGFASFSDMLENKLTQFNRAGEKLSDPEITDRIESDSQLGNYLKWLKKIRKSKDLDFEGFEEYLSKRHIPESLTDTGEEGNGYAEATFKGIRSLLRNAVVNKGDTGVIGFFGSGAYGSVHGTMISGELAKIRENSLIVDSNHRVELTPEQFEILYENLIQEEGKRTVTSEDLVEKDLKFLGRDTLSPGFHVRRRYEDGTGDWVFVEKDGEIVDVPRRY